MLDNIAGSLINMFDKFIRTSLFWHNNVIDLINLFDKIVKTPPIIMFSNIVGDFINIFNRPGVAGAVLQTPS